MDANTLSKRKKLYLSKGNKLNLASTCNDLAELYSREGKYELAIKEYLNVVKLYKELNKAINYACANRMIGEIYTTLAEFDKALEHEQIHLDIAKKENNELEEQRALASIGRTYLTKGISDQENGSESLNSAQSYFLESLEICKNLKTKINKQEYLDMKSRLLLNIGIVYEHQGDYKTGIEYMMKSINICKSNDIHERLQHGYYTLGSLYYKRVDYKKALVNFNLSIEVAKRLNDKIPPLCTTLLSKAEVLIQLAEFQSAKHVLLNAYKLKSPNIEERNYIKHTLKVVAAMCLTETKLLKTPDNDFKTKKELYEKMGDGSINLKNLKKAIDYYNKMLDCALEGGESGKDLLPIYVSLAQTYKDDKQYELALYYFQKEYEISRSNLEESYKTLLNIANVLDLANRPYEEIAKVYNQALIEAQTTGNLKIVGKVTAHFASTKKKFNRNAEAVELEKELSVMGYVSSDCENEDESDGETPDIGHDINIESLSDFSDTCETEDSVILQSTRKRGRSFAIKKNDKGETQLHTACIHGNLALVSKLLDQNHPVNIRDNSGWMPIHEACNHGHLEIVRLLVNKGSDVNDRGGTYCEGITPLHDACLNGHLEIIELLLDKGASPLTLSDNKETPLDMLLNWRKNNDLEPVLQSFYNMLVARMAAALEKAGREINNQNSKNEDISDLNALYIENPKNSPRRSPRITPNKSPYKQIGNLRNSIDTGEDLDAPSSSKFCRNSSRDSFSSFEAKRTKCTRNLSLSENDSSESDDASTGYNEYKNVIKGLRHKFPEQKSKSIKGKGKKTAFVTDDEVGDDWLENDLAVNHQGKKRKTGSNVKQNYLNSTGMRRTNSMTSSRNSNSPVLMDFDLYSDNQEENEYTISNTENLDRSHFNNKRKRSQTSLLESGFSRSRSVSPLNALNTNVTCVDKISNKPYKRQQKLHSFVNNRDNFDLDSATHQIDMNTSLSNTLMSLLAVNVRVDNKLWRIPVPANDVSILNIEWLAKEAAKRYYKQEGIFPTLQLLTKEGAILGDDDPLSMVFLSSTHADEVHSKIVSWNLPPLPKKYMEACFNLKIDVCPEIRKCLEECQGSLNLKLSNTLKEKTQLSALLRSLHRQDNIQSIDLSENVLLNDVIQQLCFTLPSITQLRSLNLSNINLSGEGLRYLSHIFTNSDRPVLENLSELNLSYNLITDDCLFYLRTIAQNIKLRILNLAGCNLTANIFDNVCNQSVTLNLDHLEVFDISYNALNTESIMTLLSFLNYRILTNLNVSQNENVSTSGIVKKIAENLSPYEVVSLKSLNLSKCKVNDNEIWDILRSLSKAHNLDFLDLSYNNDLTAVSLRRLLQHRPSFSSLSLVGCLNITEYFDQCSFAADPTSSLCYANCLKIFNVSLKYDEFPNEADCLIRMWEREWGTKARIQKSFGRLIYFTVAD